MSVLVSSRRYPSMRTVVWTTICLPAWTVRILTPVLGSGCVLRLLYFAAVSAALAGPVRHAKRVNFGDVPTWVAAIGTVGALVAALTQINTERKRRHAEETKDRAERRLAQARLVAAFLGSEETRGRPEPGDSDRSMRRPGGRTPIYLVNGSAEPAYQPVIGLVAIQGAAPRTMEQWLDTRRNRLNAEGAYRPVPITTASILPPGKSVVWIQGTGWSAHLSGRSSAEVAFTDRAGVHWIRRADGQLEELSDGPLKYFGDRGLSAPFELQTPEPLS